MATVDEGKPPPARLRLSWLAEKYRNLPESGGLLAQDYKLLHEMDVLSSVHRVVAKVRQAKGAEIHGLTDGERRILRSLRDMRLL